MPVSATATSTVPVAARGRARVIDPASVNLAALPSRLIRICRTFSWSCTSVGRSGSTSLTSSHAIALDHRLDGAQAQVDQRLEGELDRPQIHPPGLDLRQVEHGVDQRQQVLAADQDLLEVLVLLGRQHVLRAAHDQPGEADDRVERRPQLVAHVGEEDALGPARLLRLLLGRAQRDPRRACARPPARAGRRRGPSRRAAARPARAPRPRRTRARRRPRARSARESRSRP